MSRYMPHAVAASNSVLTGIIQNVRLIISGNRVSIICDVTLASYPGRRLVRGIRFYGSIVNMAVATNTSTIYVNGHHSYVSMWDDARTRGATQQQFLNALNSYLRGQTVNMVRIGGRWVIQ